MFLSRTIFCFSLFAAIVLSSYAQEENASQPTGRILGRVFDSDSLEALKGVTVVIEKSKIETTTDLEGRYRLINVKPGNYSLLFFKENYQRTRVSVEGVEADRTKIVDLPINPDYSNLETLDAFEITAEELAGHPVTFPSSGEHGCDGCNGVLRHEPLGSRQRCRCSYEDGRNKRTGRKIRGRAGAGRSLFECYLQWCSHT